jgi:hypothetical protein
MTLKLEEIQAFESDAMHYIAQMDRAATHLARILGSREISLLYNEVGMLRSSINGMGYKINEYVEKERRSVMDEIDKETART